MGHTPEQVYEAFFPADFRFLCNPSRPAVCGRFGLRQDRMWRFEFVVWPAEDGTDMASEESLERIVRPYFTRPGSEYGYVLNRAATGYDLIDFIDSVPYDVSFPKDCIETLRARPFRFSARSCNVWALGRTMLCGDSAHVFPPCKPPAALALDRATYLEFSRRTRHRVWVPRRLCTRLALENRHTARIPTPRFILLCLVSRAQTATRQVPCCYGRERKSRHRGKPGQGFASQHLFLPGTIGAFMETLT